MTPSATTRLAVAPPTKELLPQNDQQQQDGHNNEKITNATTTSSSSSTTTAPSTASPKKPMSAAERSATKKSLFILAGIFVTSLAAMFYVYMIFPELNESEKQHMKIPRDIQDAKMLAKVLDRYKDMYYFEVMFGVVVAYILYPFQNNLRKKNKTCK
ncbi:transmembrane protein 41 homolog [Musca vetustissima]|uniref:transmembrane protein 41 homolog n=1 Tax=Musca vetustissima TaxID=27455 RepID=UPI002AB692B6|nr:transmembrane protein 41 homolog [Musca vetustissima]